MTPKEKASWLVLKFMSKLISINISKQCALIVVDEIIANIEPSVSMDVISARIKYWEEVKQEIEKQ